MSSFVPDMGTLEGAPTTAVPASPPFLYAFHPHRWGVMGGRVVPMLREVPLRAGVDGVWQTRDGRFQLSDLMGGLREQGWTVIPVHEIPESHKTPGQPPSYIVKPEGRPDVHISLYTRVFPGTAYTEPDLERYLEFIEHLIGKGLVAQPETYILERLKNQIGTDLARATDRARSNSAIKDQVDLLSKAYEAVGKELAKRQKATAPRIQSKTAAVTVDTNE